MKPLNFDHRKVLSSILIMEILIVSTFLTIEPYGSARAQTPDVWWDANWLFRKPITLNQSMVVADLENFPVLIDVTDSDLKNKAQPDGGDIVFTDSVGNQLNHEIEFYSNDTGRLVAWVNVPTLSSTADTTIYMYYGNPNAEDQHVDDFNDNSTDLTIWKTLEKNNGTVSETNGRVECSIKAAPPSGTAGYITIRSYDVSNCEIQIDVSNQYLCEAALVITLDGIEDHFWYSDNFYSIQKHRWDETCNVKKRIDGGDRIYLYSENWTGPTGFLRIRIHEGIIYFYEEENLRYFEPFNLSSYNCYIHFEANTWGDGYFGTDYFDNFKFLNNKQNSFGVWDIHYMMVQHLNEESGLHYDSTSNGNDGTVYGELSQGVSGKIDGADVFVRTGGYVEVPHNSTISGFDTAFTVSFWVKLDNVDRRQTILNKFDLSSNENGWFIEYRSAERAFAFFASADGVGYQWWYADFEPQADMWYHVVVVWQANTLPKFYINGQQVPTMRVWNTISQIYDNAGAPLHIGKCTYSTQRTLGGSIDEIRISNTNRSATWIRTCYNNQEDPSNFYTIGSEETR